MGGVDEGRSVVVRRVVRVQNVIKAVVVKKGNSRESRHVQTAGDSTRSTGANRVSRDGNRGGQLAGEGRS